MELKNVMIVYMNEKTEEHERTLNKVKSTLKKHSIKFTMKERTKVNENILKNRDLVLVVGGDGTFLRAANSIKGNQLLFGINSDIHRKEGFYMQANRFDFDSKFEKVLGGAFKIRKYPRLEAFVDGKKLHHLALNEFYIGHKNSYDLSRYFLTIGIKRAYHKSSGLLVSTSSGSYGWVKHAGGKKMPITSKKIQFVAREAYEGNLFKMEMVKGILEEGQKITVESASHHNIIVPDSLEKEHKLKQGQKVEIRMSKNFLHSIVFH